MQTLTATITTTEARNGGVRILTLSPQTPLSYHAGQYIMVGTNADALRPFSIASAPAHDGTIKLHVRSTPNTPAEALCQAPAGTDIYISSPQGAMHPTHATGKHALLIAHGTGIAPMLALSTAIIRQNLSPSGVTLLFGGADANALYCRPELDALLATGDLTLLEAHAPDTPITLLARRWADFNNHAIYLAGAPQFVQAVRTHLQTQNANMAHVFSDL